MPADYHTHTPLCLHAEGAPVEYARAAVALGLTEIGLSDHSPMPVAFDDWRMRIEEFPRYLEWVAEAREVVAPYPVRLGLECDYFAGQEAWLEQLSGMADWDYLIGSVHYIAPGWDVDNPRHISRIEATGVEEVWDMYWEAYGKCIRSGLFDIMGHPDLPKKFGHRPGGDLRRYYEPAVDAMRDVGVAMELNTAGLRKPVAEIYPAPDFVRLAHAAGVPIVISSDAHAPGEVGAGFAEAIAVAREAGYSETATFRGRVRGFEAL